MYSVRAKMIAKGKELDADGNAMITCNHELGDLFDFEKIKEHHFHESDEEEGHSHDSEDRPEEIKIKKTKDIYKEESEQIDDDADCDTIRFCCGRRAATQCVACNDRLSNEGINCMIINPDNYLLIAWHFLIQFTRLFSSYAYAYIAAMRLHPGLNEDLKIYSPIIFESAFLIDFILNFLTALKNEDTNENSHEGKFNRDF